MSAATTLPACDAEAAPSPAGLIRVTFVETTGEGTSCYFAPAQLPAAMQEIARTKDVRGRTFRTRAETAKGWARLRELAIDSRLKDPEGSMLLLLWLYCSGPVTKMRVAARLQETLDQEGTACLTVVRHADADASTVAVVTPVFNPMVYRITPKLPPGVMMGMAPDDGAGSA
jgi:hypothetical protein